MRKEAIPCKKQAQYGLLCRQLVQLSEGESAITVLSNAASLLFYAMEQVNWCGFYLVSGGELVLGPFQGKPACTRLQKGKGVCGTAWANNDTVLVRDVHQFPGHVACDADSRSELVIPIRREGRVVAVLDLDSPVTGRFDQEDRQGLELWVSELEALCAGLDWARLVSGEGDRP